MELADINPYLRYAGQSTYTSPKKTVYGRDCRIFYILKGDGKIIIDNTPFPICENSVFYICSGVNYVINSDKPLHLYTLNFDLTQNHNNLTVSFIPIESERISSSLPLEEYNIKNSSFLNSFFMLEHGLNFKNIISEITEEYLTQKKYFRELCSSLLKKIIIDMHRDYTNVPDNSSKIVKKTIDYIHSNYTNELSNSTLSSIAGFHEYYLNRLFKKNIGISMHKYILNLRINQGKHLLLNTDTPVSDIAFMIGFNSNTHFSTYFKKETSMTPYEYRIAFKNNI